jgi:hypothetical protein
MTSETSQERTVPADLVSEEMLSLLQRVKSGAEHFVLEENGEAVAAIISITEYRTLMQERDRQQRLQEFRQAARSIGKAVQESGLSEAEIMADLDRAKQEVYREYYGDESD